MVERYALKETLGFCTKYLVDFTTIRHWMWDDKEDPSMFDEMFEGGGHPQILTTNLRDMAYFFMFQNVGLMALWCE
jgi:hypothetical protein